MFATIVEPALPCWVAVSAGTVAVMLNEVAVEFVET